MGDAEKKVKKKKSVPKKEEEGLTPDDAPKSRKGSSVEEPEKLSSGGSAKSRKGSSVEDASKLATEGSQKSRKGSSAESKLSSEDASKSGKSSAVENPSKPLSDSSVASEKAEQPAKPGDEVEDEDEDDEMPLMPEPPRQWDPNKIPFEAIAEAEKNFDVNAPVSYFEAPPASSKSDVDLLQNLDTRRIAELMEAFAMFDFDQDGVISMHDLRRTFASLDKPDVEEEEIKQMISEGLNPLDFDAFVVLMGYKTLELDAEEVLMNALAQWDYGTDGLISEERIRHDLMVFGDRFTEEEAFAALEDAPVVVDKVKGRMINYIKFSNDLCGLRKRMKDYKPTK